MDAVARLDEAAVWTPGDHGTYQTKDVQRLVLTRSERGIVNRAKTIRSFARSFPEIDASTDDLIPTQNWVHADIANRARDATPEQLATARQPAIAVQKGGKLYLVDGHHRLVAATLAGRTLLRVRVINFDAPSGAG